MTQIKEQTYCVGGRHMINTIIIKEQEKIIPKTQNVVKFIEGERSNCGRNKSQIYTK